MAKFTALLEQADDGTWSAHTLSPETVAGTGATREAALTDLRTDMSFWLEYMKGHRANRSARNNRDRHL